MVKVEEKWFTRADAALQEGNCTPQIFAIHFAPQRHRHLLIVQLPHSCARRALDHVARWIALGVIPRVLRPKALRVGARGAVPLIKAVVGGPATVLSAQVPLTQNGGGISGSGEDVPQGALPGGKPALVAARHHGVRTGTDSVPPRQQRGPGRGTLRLGDVVPELKPLPGELVDARRVRPAQHAAPVATQLAHAEVVDVKE